MEEKFSVVSYVLPIFVNGQLMHTVSDAVVVYTDRHVIGIEEEIMKNRLKDLIHELILTE